MPGREMSCILLDLLDIHLRVVQGGDEGSPHVMGRLHHAHSGHLAVPGETTVEASGRAELNLSLSDPLEDQILRPDRDFLLLIDHTLRILAMVIASVKYSSFFT